MRRGDRVQYRLHLSDREDRRQPGRTTRPLDLVQPRQRSVQDVPVEEEKRGQRLVLGRGGHAALTGEVAEERRDLHRPKLLRVALPVKEHEATDAADVDLLGPKAVVAPAQAVPDVIEQSRLKGELGLTGRSGRIEQSDLQWQHRNVPVSQLQIGAMSLISLSFPQQSG